MGGLQAPLQDEYVVSTTALHFKREAFSDFLQLSNAASAEAAATPGNVGVALGLSNGCDFARTITVWRSVEDMFLFVQSPAHAEAMMRTEEVAVTGAVTYEMLPAADIPISWERARDLIKDVPIL